MKVRDNNVKQMECEIVGNSKRQMVVMPDWTYVYIPMSPSEIEATESECLINPAWRIMVPNAKAQLRTK